MILKNLIKQSNFNWKCIMTWKISFKNTIWCLFGCSIGDFGTIYYFQVNNINWQTFNIMVLAIINGLITSLLLETIILYKQLGLKNAIFTAFNMSFLSMIGMEVSMNLVDYILTGEAKLNLFVIPIMLLAGLLTSWPYNYYRLKKFNISCH